MIALGGGVWMFLSGGGLDQLAVDANNPATNQVAGAWNSGAPAAAPANWPQATTANMPVTIGAAAPQLNDPPTIKIASFNIRDFGDKKLNDLSVVRTLADIVRQFDVVAIQEISTKNTQHMELFVRWVNSTGRKYSYEIGPRIGNTSQKEQYAFVFNTERIMIDRSSVYTVGDPDNLLHREPLVASFATTIKPIDSAFTFTLINVHTDPTSPVLQQELEALAEVYRVVRRAGGNEDDVIMLGDFNANDQKMAQTRLGMIPDLKPLLSGSGVFTNTRQNQLYDNLLIHVSSTSEYMGRSGVYNYAGEPLNLTLAQAETVSDHFPVWAEFSAYELDYNRRVASRATTTSR
jgi:endonuclease/exonuclease/phosphatase family metal-dependent hydrolase